MSPLIQITTTITYTILLLAMALSLWRLVRGPSLPDRIVALDFLSLVAIGFIGVSALTNGQYAYLDVAIAVALVAFLATVAFARYVFRRAEPPKDRLPVNHDPSPSGDASHE